MLPPHWSSHSTSSVYQQQDLAWGTSAQLDPRCWAARRCLGRFLLQLVPPAKSRLINFLGRWTMLEKSPVKGKRWKNHKMMEWFQLKRFYRAGTPYTRPGCSKRNPVARMVALDHPAKASLSNL